MTRRKVVFEVEAGDLFLYEISEQEKKELESFLQQTPLEFYLLRELLSLRERMDREFANQWIQKYEYRLDTAKTNFLIDEFPSKGAKHVYIHTASGTVTLNFDSVNEPCWTLTAKDFYQIPFDRLYLSWTAQPNQTLIFYVSNQKIKVTTLA